MKTQNSDITDLLLRPVEDEDLPHLRAMADAYWEELMPTADTVRLAEARPNYFTSRFTDPASQTFLGALSSDFNEPGN